MAFIGVRIPHETGRLLSSIEVPGTKEGTSELHITLLCFEDNWPISEAAKALEIVYDVVSKINPFTVKINTVDCFPKREDKPCPIIAKIESDDIHDLNKKLKKEFDKNNIDYSKIFKDFKPHITLSYADKEIKDFKIDTVEFSIQEIVLWCGDNGDDRVFITFPLKNPKKLSYLEQKINLFYKLANDPLAHFTPSKERRLIERS